MTTLDPMAEVAALERREEAEKTARTAIAAARYRLFNSTNADWVFYSQLALALRPEADWTIDTMATNGACLKYNPEFTAGLTQKQVDGVIVHEAAHCWFLHHRRLMGANAQRKNIAADAAINPMILASGLELPGGVVMPADYGWPDGMSMEWYYANFPDNKDNDKGGDGKPGPGDVEDAPETGEDATIASKEQWQVAVAAAECVAQQRGQLSAGLQRVVGEILRPKTPWQDVLEQFITQRTRSDYAWTRPNQRYAHLGVYLPDLHSLELGHLVVFIDTSGSIGQRILDLFAGHLESIISCAPAKLTIVYGDTRPQRVEEWTSSDGPLKLKPHGGGGTDHRWVAEWLTDNCEDAVAAILLSDGYTSYGHAPSIPCLWAMTTAKVAPWGQTMQIME